MRLKRVSTIRVLCDAPFEAEGLFQDMTNPPAIIWLRNDLRLRANPALQAAVENKQPAVMVYILEDVAAGGRPMGAASKWWLDKSLRALDSDLRARGGKLILRKGDAQTHLRDIAGELETNSILWNRRYEKTGRDADQTLKARLKDDGFEVRSTPGNLLMEPWKLTTQDGGPYRVYSPFWRALQKAYAPPPTSAPPQQFSAALNVRGDDLSDWGLHPTRPDWSGGLAENWTPGEAGAQARLDAFLNEAIDNYADKRDFPAVEATSRLSPHLHFGEISAHDIWIKVDEAIQAGRIKEKPAGKFLSEIAWREFSHHLLYHFPYLPSENHQPKFNAFAWRDDEVALEAWRRGRTGYPIVDAGLRELWETGWMHNRVRMIVASFLTKHLLIHWREGEDWFWDTLVDADAANNAASWQWVAGSGADAAPYFRIFNPMTQGEKFDPKGDYVRRWLPELARLSDKHIHQPWDASDAELRQAGVALGEIYPKPIVEHGAARTRALAAYDDVKNSA